ncbi:hypothetical protein L210DRAFT_880307, partial [Boletus edulis BED1]
MSNTNDHKICRCKPTCYKWLSKPARDRHYAKADATELLPSASELGSSPNLGYLHSKPELDGEDQTDNLEAADLEDFEDCSVEGVDAKNSSGEEDEEAVVQSSMEHLLDMFKFHECEENQADPGLLYHSAKMIETELRALLGPAREQEMYSL